MWIQWLVHGIPDAPKASETVCRAAADLLAASEENGDWDEALRILSAHDPVRSEKLPRNDWYRMRRYLEVALSIRAGERGDVPDDEEEGKEEEAEGEEGERGERGGGGDDGRILTGERRNLLEVRFY
jgi:hypothetical protein